MKIRNKKAFTLVELMIVFFIIIVLAGIVKVVFMKTLKTPEVTNSIVKAVRAYETERGQIDNLSALEILGSFGSDEDLQVLVTFFSFENGRNYYLVNSETGEISVMSRLTAEEMGTMFPVNEQNETDPDTED